MVRPRRRPPARPGLTRRGIGRPRDLDRKRRPAHSCRTPGATTRNRRSSARISSSASGHWLVRGEMAAIDVSNPDRSRVGLRRAQRLVGVLRRPLSLASALAGRRASGAALRSAKIVGPSRGPDAVGRAGHRIEGVVGFRATRRLEVRAGWQHNWRDAGRVHERGFPAVQALLLVLRHDAGAPFARRPCSWPVCSAHRAPRPSSAPPATIRGQRRGARKAPVAAARPAVVGSRDRPQDRSDRPPTSVVYLDSGAEAGLRGAARPAAREWISAASSSSRACSPSRSARRSTSRTATRRSTTCSRSRRREAVRSRAVQAGPDRRSVRFDRPGIVPVFCDIHSHMSAYILIFSHPFFAVTDDDGRYSIRGVPARRRTPLVVWSELGRARARNA